MRHSDLTPTVDERGDLVLTVGAETRAEIPQMRERMSSDQVLWELFEPYWANGMYEPFDAGEANPFVGLTSAPCIAEEMDTDDDGKKTIVGRCWWFPNYMVEDPVETLAKEGRVVFTLAKED